MLMLVLFFESICFPTIFTLGIRGLGHHTKTGSSFIVASIVGGAVVPPLLGHVADKFNDTGRAMFIPLIFFVVGVSFAFGVNFHTPTVKLVDGFHESKVGIEDVSNVRAAEDQIEGEKSSTEKDQIETTENFEGGHQGTQLKAV